MSAGRDAADPSFYRDLAHDCVREARGRTSSGPDDADVLEVVLEAVAHATRPPVRDRLFIVVAEEHLFSASVWQCPHCGAEVERMGNTDRGFAAAVNAHILPHAVEHIAAVKSVDFEDITRQYWAEMGRLLDRDRVISPVMNTFTLTLDPTERQLLGRVLAEYLDATDARTPKLRDHPLTRTIVEVLAKRVEAGDDCKAEPTPSR